ncbi:helix-turn-helix domain-containing protein [Legionella septentrionalis]|uniref:Helix-turn-helix domain-containing protein n=1 Tax=Legionella septentrionalis TaxID=2498109 RepID=A0A433JHB1_9GAMM|nr:helix-turn-helix domain-containing protein [Legionella septentrionalis]RUQ81719.1 helix-turn-helix domain-containing protein [Legionella septentrionalis]RUR02784.1 helix-turn-helix domain-containing protein [Legionella septentrionalis]RUR11382.1 helix-turn-helix domain-containing protein [Legionella septentrionalis]
MLIKNLTISSHLLLAQTLDKLLKYDKKLTPAALARELGIPTNKITRILNGDVTDPKASTLLQIANYFEITIGQLLGIEPLSSDIKQVQDEGKMLPVFQINKSGYQKIYNDWYRWAGGDVEGVCYALSIDTDIYEPTFPQDSLLIINQDIAPDDRSYIVVKKNTSAHYFIRRYVEDGNKIFFYPINPQFSIEIYDKSLYTIAGVILEIHQKLRSKK